MHVRTSEIEHGDTGLNELSGVDLINSFAFAVLLALYCLRHGAG